MLTRGNYLRWQMAIKAFLTPFNHRDTSSALVDPTRPTGTAGLEAWETSEGISMSLGNDLRFSAHQRGYINSISAALGYQHAYTGVFCPLTTESQSSASCASIFATIPSSLNAMVNPGLPSRYP